MPQHTPGLNVYWWQKLCITQQAEKAGDWYFLGINTNIFGLPSREGHLSLVKSDVIVLMSMGLSSVPHIPCSVPVLWMMQQKQSLLEKSLCAVSVRAFNMSLVVR